MSSRRLGAVVGHEVSGLFDGLFDGALLAIVGVVDGALLAALGLVEGVKVNGLSDGEDEVDRGENVGKYEGIVLGHNEVIIGEKVGFEETKLGVWEGEEETKLGADVAELESGERLGP
eukprot:jgi/Bigna1/135181/aug1.28_g9889